jgi:hypothetical protein
VNSKNIDGLLQLQVVLPRVLEGAVDEGDEAEGEGK